MALDLNGWLEEATKRAGLSAEERKTLEGVLGSKPGFTTYLEESGLRQSDYDRKMNKLKEEHEQRLAEIAEKEAAADRFATQNGEWYAQNNSAFIKAQKDIATLREKEAALTERMRGLATRYGVPEEELNIPAPVAPAVPDAAAPAFDTSKFVSRDEAMKEMAAMPLVTAELQELAEDHRDLFGKPLRGAKDLVQKAIKANKSIRQVWEEENKVADRRKANEEAAINKRIEDAVRERETKIRSEVNLPAPRPTEQRSPVVDHFAKGRVAEAKDSGRGLRAALAAYNEGKYRGAA